MRLRLITGILLLLAAFGMAGAQNNPLEINDECYKLYLQAENKLGKDGFTQANEQFLRSALTYSDTKSQTLYYLGRLKNAIQRIPGGTVTTDEQDAEITKLQEDLMTVADKLGYPQYYYYAFELAQNYFYSHNKSMRAMELMQDLQKIAEERKDVYGLWMSQRYMVALYVDQGDYLNAKPHIQSAIRLYETSQDSVVRSQSPTRLYCDLSDTYLIGADSVKINIDKAVKAADSHLDSLRCAYHLAKIKAYEQDAEAYAFHRDYCLADKQLSIISPTASLVFQTLDAIMEGRFDASTINSLSAARVREIKYIANVAEKYGYKEQGFEIERLLVGKFENQMADANRAKLTELDARLGNNALEGQLETESQRIARITRLIFILLAGIMVAIITFLIVHIRSLRKHNSKLMEANERVRLADAAKTRFVQNMSHEVRTPLNAIVGFSQLLSLPDGALSPEEKDEFAAHIVNNTKMLTMLLDDILNASAMDSGNYSITYETGEKDYMAQAAISSAEHRLQPGVSLTYEPEEPKPFSFTTDPRRVQQILINLITNACKHTSEGSIVVSSSLQEHPGYVTYAITDTGTGIAPEDAEKIFERFTKLNDYVQGTGLGLSICRDIAGRLGAKVFLDTTHSGKGSRFVFQLPIHPDSPDNPVQ